MTEENPSKLDSPERIRGVSSLVRTIGARLGAWLGHESIPQMAAALAYRTIFSLIPILILSLLVLRLFQDERQVIREMLGRVLELAGLNQLSLGDAQEVSVQGRLEELVNSFSGLSFTGIGLVSAATLIYAAISLIAEVENSFNRVFGSVRGRSWVRRVMQYWMLLTLGPLLVFASFYTAQRFFGIAEGLAEAGGGTVIGAWLLGLAGYLVSVSITCLLLLVVYTVVPNAVVRWRAALGGALLAAVLLELGKYGFKLYLENAGYRNLYGSLALLPLFLMWVYITWVIVLFGLRSAYLYQHGKRLALFTLLESSAGMPGQGGAVWTEPSCCLLIMQADAAAFARGQSLDLPRLAMRVGLAEELVRQAVEALERNGLLLAVGRSSRGERYVLARPAETIKLRQILAVGQLLAGDVSTDIGPAAGALRDIRRAQLDALGERTLADLLAPSAASPVRAEPTIDNPEPANAQPANAPLASAPLTSAPPASAPLANAPITSAPPTSAPRARA